MIILNRYIIICCFIFFNGITFVRAQDVLFSWLPYVPLFLNPAQAGYYDDNNYRAGMVYRLQKTPVGTAYNTFMGWADIVLQPRIFKRGWLGLAIYGVRDNTTGSVLTTTKAAIATGYHHMVTDNMVISVGLNVTFVSRSLDVSKIIFGDQFDGVNFTPSIPTRDVFFINQSRYFSLQPSFMFTYRFSDNDKIVGGFSMENVNVPKTGFIGGADPIALRPHNGGTKFAIPFRYNANILYIRQVADNIAVHSYGYFAYQAKAQQILLGVYMNYDLIRKHYFSLIGGFGYRVNRSGMFMVGLANANFRFGMVYDLSFISSSYFRNTYSTFEFSLIYSGMFTKKKGVSAKTKSVLRCFAF